MPRYARYSLWIVLGLIAVSLAIFFSCKALIVREIPNSQAKPFHYEAVEVEEKNVYIAWAETDGHPKNFLRVMTICNPENFNFSNFSGRYPYFRRADRAIDSADQVEVKQKLPPGSYVLELGCGKNSIILPLDKIASDTYVSPPFLLLNQLKGADYFHGVRALSCKPGLTDINFNFKKVVFDGP